MNIGVAGPRVLIRKSLCVLLSHLPDLRVLFDLDNPLDDLEAVQKAHPDILLLDCADPVKSLEILSRLQTLAPEMKILLLSDEDADDFQLRAIRAGARGFISKASDPVQLERALKGVARGEIWVGHKAASLIIGKLVRSYDSGNNGAMPLTRRESQIVALLADGRRNKEIARLLAVSENTIRAHLVALYKKIRVNSRLGAALYYFEHNPNQPRPAPVSAPSAPSRRRRTHLSRVVA